MMIHNNSRKVSVQPSQPSSFANFLWIVILALAGIGGSLVISCVIPFIASRSRVSWNSSAPCRFEGNDCDVVD